MKAILFGATGMVGEGVLLECLINEEITNVLSVSRKSTNRKHEKLEELLISDLNEIERYKETLSGFDTCFYCLGKSSNGMSEEDYTALTYHLTITIAKVLKEVNPGIVFCFISGASTDSTEKGRMMWARVKGRTENELIAMFQKNAYNFRPALMKPGPEQKNFRGYNRIMHKTLFPILKLFLPHNSIQNIARAMIYVSKQGNDKQILEVKDIQNIINIQKP